MLKSSDRDLSAKKIPIRSPRTTKKIQAPTPFHPRLTKKYLSISVNAFYFRKTQDYLQFRPLNRELSLMTSEKESFGKYFNFEEVKQVIRGVVMERVEKDFIFGVTFNTEWRVLEKYVHLQRRLKQRNFYNRYYFSSCPPKISNITQPTTLTLSLKGPETNSTIELKALTHNIDLMLTKPKASSKMFITPEKRYKKDKSQRMKKKRPHEELPEESYGLRNYQKERKSKARGSQSKNSKIHYCVTPQPHCQKIDFSNRSPMVHHPRLSERVLKSKSGLKRSVNNRSKGK